MDSDAIRPRPTGTFREKDLGNEYLFFDNAGKKFHVLNRTAREIYLLCDGARTPRDIARALADRYEVSEIDARQGTKETIGTLVEKGILNAG